jgi:hypothetical protein
MAVVSDEVAMILSVSGGVGSPGGPERTNGTRPVENNTSSYVRTRPAKNSSLKLAEKAGGCFAHLKVVCGGHAQLVRELPYGQGGGT